VPFSHLSNHAYQPTKSVVNNGPGPVSISSKSLYLPIIMTHKVPQLLQQKPQ